MTDWLFVLGLPFLISLWIAIRVYRAGYYRRSLRSF